MQPVSDTIEGVGKKTQYLGHNMPLKSYMGYHSERRISNPLVVVLRKYHGSTYMITYVRGDEHTKKHELLHGAYNLCESYKRAVDKAYDSLDAETKGQIKNLLTTAGYRDLVHVDEFQAYLVTNDTTIYRGKIRDKLEAYRSVLTAAYMQSQSTPVK